MASNARTIAIEIKTDEQGFSEVVRRYDDGTRRIAGSTAGIDQAFSKWHSNLLRVSATLGLGFGVASFVKGLVDLGDKLSDLSDATGLSIAVLGGLKPLVDQSNSSIDQFATGILRAQKSLGGITNESDPAAQAIKSLGLNLREMMAASPDEFLQKFATGLATVEDRNRRAALATALLGKSGAELIPIVMQIAERGLPRLNDEAAKGFRILGDLKDALVRATGEAASFWAAMLGKAAGLISVSSEIDLMKRKIEDLSAFLVTMKLRMGDAFEVDPKMTELQAWLTGLQVTLEKMSGSSGAKPLSSPLLDPKLAEDRAKALDELRKQIAAVQLQTAQALGLDTRAAEQKQLLAEKTASLADAHRRNLGPAVEATIAQLTVEKQKLLDAKDAMEQLQGRMAFAASLVQGVENEARAREEAVAAIEK
jgi:hypothetical protein